MALETFETTILYSSMAKRRRVPNSDDDTAEYNTVFMDTSLDTHFAMLVSNSDTVKRMAQFYHLPDTMLVWSAFDGVKKSWFLWADASDLTLKQEAKKKTKRKRFKKSGNANLENSGLPCPSTAHIPEESNKEQGIILYRKGEDVQLKLHLNTSTPEASEKVQGTTTNGNEVQYSPGNGDACFPAVENKDQINTENIMDEKAREKINSASVVEEILPVKDQMVGIEALTTEDNSNTEEGIHVASSLVLSRKSEEKLEAMHEVAVNTVHLSENQAEGINFNHYFMPDQDKVDSCGKVKQSNEEMKKVKKNGLPSVSISTESHVSKDSGKTRGDSPQNSPNSSTRFPDSIASAKMPDINLQNPNKILAVTKTMMMKKSLLSKPGAIFEDNSGDENGTAAHSDGSIPSPSDSSSSASGDSYLSQDSSRNGMFF
ncbi:hypothetical protein DH2020_003924 [Rehmannia glutinosa]|uniref:Uncharacterized protein n=1 Tax=Rehmannia glutinosa TaxID=99300 RepID=A0ABR0XNB9_REHGL